MLIVCPLVFNMRPAAQALHNIFYNISDSIFKPTPVNQVKYQLFNISIVKSIFLFENVNYGFWLAWWLFRGQVPFSVSD